MEKHRNDERRGPTKWPQTQRHQQDTGIGSGTACLSLSLPHLTLPSKSCAQA